jgi:zinc transport system substrate-binding protein
MTETRSRPAPGLVPPARPARRTRVALRLLAFAATLALAVPAHAAPSVVASIVPIHGLVASVMEGVGEPHLLVPPGASPHDYALKPSDAAALAAADLVVWVGPGLESFLVHTLETLPAGTRRLALMEAKGVTLLANREGDEHAEDDHADEGEAEGELHDHGAFDPHIWLDPLNAQAIVHAIGTALAELDPVNAEAYWANVDATRTRLARLDTTFSGQLAAAQSEPFVVFHDAYRYLENRYRLTSLGAIAVEPGRAPSAQRIADLRRRIVGLGAACVFAEPQYDPGLVETIAEGTGARVGVLDPEGGVEPGPRAYDNLMKALVASLARCLTE